MTLTLLLERLDWLVLLLHDLPATVLEEVPGSSWVLAVAAGLLAGDCSNLCCCWEVAGFQEACNDLHDGQPPLSKHLLNLLHMVNNMLLLDNSMSTDRQTDNMALLDKGLSSDDDHVTTFTIQADNHHVTSQTVCCCSVTAC